MLAALRMDLPRWWSRDSLLTVLVAVFVGCANESAPADDASLTPAEATHAIPRPGSPLLFLDMVADAARAHFRRFGPLLDPAGPGWRKLARVGEKTWNAAHAVDGPESWLEGLGGTLTLVVGEEGPSARRLRLRLRPVAAGQVVSLFLDGAALTTLHLDAGARDYYLELPQGLKPGEHALRFWFRFTRTQAGLRTPAALGQVELLPAGSPPPPPVDWTGSVGTRAGRALLAGPPSSWRFSLVPPRGGTFLATAAVAEGPAVVFKVLIEADQRPPIDAVQLEVKAGESAEVSVALGAFEGTPIRLSLVTEGETGGLTRAGWTGARLVVPSLPLLRPEPARSLVLWVVDGLRSDRVSLGRGGERAATPNLDLLAREGAAAVDVWTSAGSAEGHQQLLRPSASRRALAARVSGRAAAIISTSGLPDASLTEGFAAKIDLKGDVGQTARLLREVETFLDEHPRQPFFLYLVTHEPQDVKTSGYLRQYQRARPLKGPLSDRERERGARDQMAAYDAQVSEADYWIGQLVSLLVQRGRLSETTLLVTGSVGRSLNSSGLNPGLLQTPFVLWHPVHREQQARPLGHGAALPDVHATALGLLGARLEEDERSLAPALLSGHALPPYPVVTRQGGQVAVRYGHWFMATDPARTSRLWSLERDPTASFAPEGACPIALSTLREALLDAVNERPSTAR